MADQQQELQKALAERQMVWIYIGFQHWALKDEATSEIIAEVHGGMGAGVYTYKGRKYHGEMAAKEAAMRDVRCIPSYAKESRNG